MCLPWFPTDRLVSYSFIILHDAHTLQGHEAAVRIGVYHLGAHLVDLVPSNNSGGRGGGGRLMRWRHCHMGSIGELVERFLQPGRDARYLVVQLQKWRGKWTR